MSTLTTASLPRNNSLPRYLIIICLSLLSAYPIYKSLYSGRGVLTYERHIALIEGRSEFFNPWQYRMLSPFVVEGLLWIYNHTIDKVYPVEEKFHFTFTQTSEPTPETKELVQLLQTKGAVKYLIVFLFLRFCLDFLVFVFCWKLWRYFTGNDWLILFGLCFISLSMGNGVIASDLTFNTYLDNLFYLLTACLIVYRWNPLWLLPVSLLAAFNRETGMLIPFLYFISQIDFRGFHFNSAGFRAIRFPSHKVWLITSAAYILFFVVFAALRLYYGYHSPQTWKVPAGIEMIKLNLFSSVAIKSCFEMLGAFSIIPLILLYRFKVFPVLLKVWFLGIVPVWFAVHVYSVVIYQTRLFLVPIIIVFMPMLLWLVDQQYRKQYQAIVPAS